MMPLGIMGAAGDHPWGACHDPGPGPAGPTDDDKTLVMATRALPPEKILIP